MKMKSAPAGVLRPAAGFTLIELVVALLIIGILTAIAYPSYLNNVARTRRAAAEACLLNYTTHMERFYTTNMRYDATLDGDAMATAELVALDIDCASAQNTGQYYSYSFAEDQPTATTYTLLATPLGGQAERDAQCGVLSINHTGSRGAEGDVDKCW